MERAGDEIIRAFAGVDDADPRIKNILEFNNVI
jgi:hypothetical protein